MKRSTAWRSAFEFWLIATAVAALGAASITRAADTLTFSASDSGSTKSIAEWGYDTAWPSYDNARLSILTFGGADRVDTVRVNFHEFEPLEADGSLGPQSRAAVDYAASLAKLAGTKPISLTPDTGAGTHAWYLDAAGGVVADRYASLITRTARYLADRHGLSVGAVEVWNEPDYWPGQPTAAQVATITSLVKSDPLLRSAVMIGPSTLSPNTWWYDQIAESVTVGATHKLGGSASDYIGFIQRVRSNGDDFSNPEAHSLAEVLMAAEYGARNVIWWGPALNARGRFVQASDGVRLGYAENRGDETAAAVYRAPDGRLHMFAGSFERQGTPTAYRVVSGDRDVYFDGVGPIREYMITATRDVQGAITDVTYGSDAIGQGTALDGNRWSIVNRETGQVLQVTGGSAVNGGGVNAATDTGSLAQRWNVTRSDDGYYTILNANSGIALDIANGSLADGGQAQQWGGGEALPQLWTIETAGGGAFVLRNGNSGKVLNGDSTRAYQSAADGSARQQWQFVAANPPSAGGLRGRYEFQGNASDSAGTRHATLSGGVAYVAGPTAATGTALAFNGSTTYATLPAGAATSGDITLSTWVNWNGGGSWQRIFDFGNDTSSYLFLTPSSGDGTMRFAITTSGGTGEQVLDTAPLPTGQWVHLAVTLSGNTGVLYVDGAPRVAGRILLDPDDVNPTRNYLGKSQYADPLFNGSLDDFRIYDRALSPAEVANLVPVSRCTWTGGVDSRWTTATFAGPTNWKLTFNDTATDYADGESIVFDDTAAAFTVRTDADVRPRVATFHHAAAYTLTGSAGISGTATLVKNGLGTLTIANANTYSGATTINTGTVILSGTLAGTAVSVDAAVFTQTSTGALSSASLTTLGITSLSGSNSLTSLQATGPGSVTIAGGLTSSSGVVVIGDRAGDRSVLRVQSATLVAGGTGVRIAASSGGSGSLVLATGGTLATTAVTGGLGASTLALAGGVLRPLASGTAFVAGVSEASVRGGGAVIDTNGFDVAIPQALVHDASLGSVVDGGLTKRGAGTLTLAGANTYTGTTSVATGTLVVAHRAALGSGAVRLTNATLVLRTDGVAVPNTLSVGSAVSGTVATDVRTAGPGVEHRLGPLLIGTASSLHAVAGGNVSGGRPMVTIPTVSLVGISTGSTTFAATTAGLTLGGVASTTTFPKTVVLAGTSDSSTVSGGIANGAGVVSVVKNDAGSWILSGSSTYTGLTTVNGGRLSVNGSIAGSTIVNSGGMLSGTGTVRTVAVFAGGMLAPGSTAGTGTMRVVGNLTLAAGSTFGIDVTAVNGAVDVDHLAATGDVTINGGALDLAARESPAPAWLVPREIITGRRLAGTFATVDGVELTGGRRLAITYSSTSVIMTAAAAGDLNLDGVVDFLDTAEFASAARFDSGAGSTWSHGDFNGDGLVDFLDVAGLLTSGLYDNGPYAGAVAAGGEVAVVPEPHGLAAGVCAAAVVLRQWLARRTAPCIRKPNRVSDGGRTIVHRDAAVRLTP